MKLKEIERAMSKVRMCVDKIADIQYMANNYNEIEKILYLLNNLQIKFFNKRIELKKIILK